jgi:chromosome segregation ATPase
MTEEDNLRKRINELQLDLNKKENEINLYLDKIDGFEEEVMRYEEMFDEKAPKKKMKKIKEEKLHIELDAKDREVRELKNRMGFLRKEKMELQTKHNNLVRRTTDSSVISVEELREKDKPPLNLLLHELQDKLNKQESLIRRLKRKDLGSNEYNEKLREKDEKIELLTSKITDLTEKIENSSSQIEPKLVDNKNTKNLLEDLQKKLNKTKRQNEELKKVVTKYEKKNKDKKGKAEPEPIALKEVVEELKSKLSKSKAQITTLQGQIKEGQNQEAPTDNIPQVDIEGKLKIQREMASFLQNQLAESKNALKTKEEEITTIKNEAIRIKRKFEDLDNQLKLKDQKSNEIEAELDILRFQIQNQANTTQTVNPDINLRFKELESLVDDLNKQNIEQRLEISQLRKSK